MFDIFGETYFVDIDAIERYIDLDSKQKAEFSGETPEQRINLVRYELVKTMLDVIMSEGEEIDEKMGMKASSGLSIPFKIAVNSLLNKKLINHY